MACLSGSIRLVSCLVPSMDFFLSVFSFPLPILMPDCCPLVNVSVLSRNGDILRRICPCVVHFQFMLLGRSGHGAGALARVRVTVCERLCCVELYYVCN